ncbi:MAG: hypothetical protein A3G93_01140 [Nitrospinae bacterium RIFCSPLOWO2_12_FULL_45_22]|nr:MAG: hypothetical protein A3G93_01140 [Nitrospinae bacterium RIFCSPLOWO2_12_FULL_45_22]
MKKRGAYNYSPQSRQRKQRQKVKIKAKSAKLRNYSLVLHFINTVTYYAYFLPSFLLGSQEARKLTPPKRG